MFAMPTMFTTYFWKSALERALKSFAQALLAVVGVGSVGILDVAWAPALSTAAMAGVLSVLTSIASAKVGTPDDPSLVPPAEPAAEPAVEPAIDNSAAVQPRHAAATA